MNYKGHRNLGVNKMLLVLLSKVNSVQEAFAKCFAVHILKFEILETTQKKIKINKEDQHSVFHQ